MILQFRTFATIYCTCVGEHCHVGRYIQRVCEQSRVGSGLWSARFKASRVSENPVKGSPMFA